MTLPQHQRPVDSKFAQWQRFRAAADGVVPEQDEVTDDRDHGGEGGR